MRPVTVAEFVTDGALAGAAATAAFVGDEVVGDPVGAGVVFAAVVGGGAGHHHD